MTKSELDEIIKSEGDYFEWTNSLKCFIQRNSLGAWCGYTTIPKSFPIDFDDEIHLNCHGGVTYQSQDQNGDLVVGFDCAHVGDLVPKIMEFNSGFMFQRDTYRDKQYVIDEVNSMVEQVLQIVEFQRNQKISKILDSK